MMFKYHVLYVIIKVTAYIYIDMVIGGRMRMTKTKTQLYSEIIKMVNDRMKELENLQADKRLYYISAEFLIGKMLKCNLINLGMYEEVEQLTQSYGYTMAEIEDMEQEPSLGNGGLGRLAACYLDSIASLGLPGDGIGLYYHFGLFKQKFEKHMQKEYPDSWISEDTWFHKTDVTFDVKFKNLTLSSVMYEMDIVGYHGKKNTLSLFDVKSIDETIVHDGITFDKKDIEKNLTLFLYPDDSDEDGRLLRIYQQYFMVSNGAQYMLADCKQKGYDIRRLYDHVCIQINDTHPTLIIPELIRLLMLEGIDMKEAIHIVEKTCAYTNHTILAEALETWPKDYLNKVVPEIMIIIEALDTLMNAKTVDEKVGIIDVQGNVHMAHIDLHYGKSVNGVAALHSEILKETELKAFFDLYPEKFNNKTNGITFRRWLFSANQELTQFLIRTLGKKHVERLQFDKLLEYIEEKDVLMDLYRIKQIKKQQFCDYMKIQQNIDLDKNSIFDIQIKRLHEYKRQQMNALYIIYKYKQIKKGVLPKTPITFVFGAKAAPAYTIAKDIIHLLLCLQTLINEDPDVNNYIRICFIENYNITKAEKAIPACDISEQISLASKEASGTGNMKFMLNGAVTLGTRDGANIEIEELVGNDNIFVFGESSDQVIEHYAKQDYNAKALYKSDEQIKALVDFIIDKPLLTIGDEQSLQRLYDEILNKDWFMALLDLQAYIACKDQAFAAYEDHLGWSKRCLINIAKSGFFSSDRAIMEYNRDIWNL